MGQLVHPLSPDRELTSRKLSCPARINQPRNLRIATRVLPVIRVKEYRGEPDVCRSTDDHGRRSVEMVLVHRALVPGADSHLSGKVIVAVEVFWADAQSAGHLWKPEVLSIGRSAALTGGVTGVRVSGGSTVKAYALRWGRSALASDTAPHDRGTGRV